jgi:thiosulfate/3-mercaptopyruvate sulfurtransferase
LRTELRRTAEQILGSLQDSRVQLIDARDEAQFTGIKRRGPRGGHIPGAINLPREVFFAPDGGFAPVAELRQIVEAAGVDLSRPIVAYCNGGVAATVALFSLYRLGVETAANYDGSWNEWGARNDLPAATGTHS